MTYQTTLNRKCRRLVGWAALDFYFRLARLKQSHWWKNCKPFPFSEPKPLMAEKAGFEGEGEVEFRSPGKIRDARDEGFQETCRTCQDSNKTPKRRARDNGICVQPRVEAVGGWSWGIQPDQTFPAQMRSLPLAGKYNSKAMCSP